MKESIRYASLKTIRTTYEHESVYEKAKSYKGNKIIKRLFDWTFDQMAKRGFLQTYFEDIKIDTYDHAPSKRKLISDKVLEAIHEHENHFGHVSPKTHVIMMGEDDFFQSVNEQKMNSPFFGREPMQLQTDIRYNTSGYSASSMGFPIYVVPSINGLAIVPKNIIEKHV